MRRLLVVDDDEATAHYVEAIGSRCGYKTTTAYDGVEAVNTARKVSPDCSVMGIMMPGMNGFESAAEILRFQPHCRFVFMSGWEGSLDLMGQFKVKGYDFQFLLPKPFDAMEVICALGLAGCPIEGAEVLPLNEVVQLAFAFGARIGSKSHPWTIEKRAATLRDAASANPEGVMNFLRCERRYL